MAQQKFNNGFREALWETYHKKCFHCSGELLLFDMQIDHIVPERLLNVGAAEREAALKEIGLRSDFDIEGNGNLAPTCPRCNGGKGGSVLIGQSSTVALTRIQRSLPLLEKNLAKQREARKLEDVLLAVSRALSTETFTRDEFLREFDRISKSPLPVPAPESRHSYSGEQTLPPDLRFIGPHLAFTEQAWQTIGARNLSQDDVADAVFNGLRDGSAVATMSLRSHTLPNYCVVRGAHNLEVGFKWIRGKLVVWTVKRE